MSYKSLWDFGRSAKAKVGPHALVEYPSKILPYAAHEIVNRFSKEGDLILDPFCGCGTFAIEAKALNRNSINYDINKNAVQLVHTALNGFSGQRSLTEFIKMCPGCEQELKRPLQPKKTTHIAEVCDSRKLGLPDQHVDAIITDIPYGGMIKYSNQDADLSNLEDYDQFVLEVTKSFKEMWRVLKPNSYCTIFAADYRVGAARKILPIHADVISEMRTLGFTLFDLFVWRYYRSGGFRPFGRKPFQAMNVHSYILVFYKPGEGGESDRKNREIRYRSNLIKKLNKNDSSD